MATGLKEFPKTQYAVQLVGPGQLKLNRAKDVVRPGPYQVLAQIEAVGLCFSDLKLLKQFTDHVRKGRVVKGIAPEVLAEISSYVPGLKPGVPGHEAVCRLVAVGEKVRHHKVGERCLIQTDYRDLRTEAGSNAAFGYNFEGALQEYVIMDERVIMEPKTGERFLIPVTEELSASAVCLVEPWACVEDSYVNQERRTVRKGGKLLVVIEPGHKEEGLKNLVAEPNVPASVRKVEGAECNPEALAKLANESFDDVIYFGSNPKTIEILNDKLAPFAIMNVVLGGKTIGRAVSVGIGRVHYGMTRWIGTAGADAGESYKNVPTTGELRAGERALVVGAGGPMGQMHVIRDVCSGVKDLTLVGTDVDDTRLESLYKKAAPLAKANGVSLRMVNPKTTPMAEKFSYFALMAPVGALVADAIKNSLPGCLINIFAGIPAPTKQELDLDTYIRNRCFMFGTSGSVIRDMKIVLDKMDRGALDTNCSVDAVSGMAGAADGIRAVENRTLAGKIIVYPSLHEVGLIPLSKLPAVYPTVAAKLVGGQWTKAAEEELLKVAK